MDGRFEISLERSGKSVYVAAYTINETTTRSMIKDKVRCASMDDALKMATFHINSLIMKHNILI